jgi:hypothetical protein
MSGETFSVDVSAMRNVWEVKDAILDQGRSSCEFRLYRALVQDRRVVERAQ